MPHAILDVVNLASIDDDSEEDRENIIKYIVIWDMTLKNDRATVCKYMTSFLILLILLLFHGAAAVTVDIYLATLRKSADGAQILSSRLSR